MPYSAMIFGAGQIAAGYDDPFSKAILTHAHAIRENNNFNLLGFFDIDQEKARIAADKWECSAYKEPEKADVITICTPDKFHFESIQQTILLNPKIIILEKPIAANYNDAKKIIDISLSIPIQVNFTRRFVKEFQDLSLQIHEYGAFLTGNGLYGKGFIHNGSHMLDLLRFLIGEIESIQNISKINDFFLDDPTQTVRVAFGKGGVFFMQAVDCRKYTIFELDLCFEKARIRILDSGYKIQIYETKSSDKFEGYTYLNLNTEINTQMDRAIYNLYQNVHMFLSNEDILYSPVQKVFFRELYA